jgi:hypothetical protein
METQKARAEDPAFCYGQKPFAAPLPFIRERAVGSFTHNALDSLLFILQTYTK